MDGTIEDSICNLTGITYFDVFANLNSVHALTGTIPHCVQESWKGLRTFNVAHNNFSGPLPALPFADMAECLLFNHVDNGTNSFDCPFPDGVVGKCYKTVTCNKADIGCNSDGKKLVHVTSEDCTPLSKPWA